MQVDEDVEAPTDAELHALIEEARRRARKRRFGIAALTLGFLGLIAGIVLAVRGGGHSQEPFADETGSASQRGTRNFIYLLSPPGSPTEGGLIRVDPGSGAVRRLPVQVGCGHAIQCLIPVGDKLGIASVGATDAFGRAEHGALTRAIGRGWIGIPSSDRQTLWLGVLSRHQELQGARQLSEIHQVDATGKVVRSLSAPGLNWRTNNWPDEAPAGGLVYERDGLSYWSLAKRRFTGLRIPGIIAADARGPLIASCALHCPRYAITNVKNGGITLADPPSGFDFQQTTNGAFQPDLSHIALPVVAREDTADSNDPTISLALVDTRTGVAELIPRSASDSIYAPVLAWSQTGDRLYFLGRGDRVMAFEPGEGTHLLTRLGTPPKTLLIEMADASR